MESRFVVNAAIPKNHRDFSLPGEVNGANAGISAYCTATPIPWIALTAEACRANAVITGNRAIIYRMTTL